MSQQFARWPSSDTRRVRWKSSDSVSLVARRNPAQGMGCHMGAREIPIAQWPEFLDQFSREHRAWLATVERVPGGEPGHTDVVERPLDAVTAFVAGQRIERIDIRFQEDAQARRQIQVDAPTSVRVDETAEGTVRGLEIIDKHGDATRIRFRAAPLPEMLDGIAPGEQPFS
jgi:hypothetical protein